MNDTITAFARLADQARSRIEEISAGELSQTKPLPVIIDVRESDEYAEGHVQTARHLSRGVMEQKIDEFVPDFSTPVVVYCDRGDRSRAGDGEPPENGLPECAFPARWSSKLVRVRGRIGSLGPVRAQAPLNLSSGVWSDGHGLEDHAALFSGERSLRAIHRFISVHPN